MKTRKFFTSIAAFVFVTVLMPAVFVSTSYATTGINLISQTHHVWGVADGTLVDDTYDYTSSAPVSGSASALWWGGYSKYTESNPGTNTETSFAGDFRVYAQDGSCWISTASRCFAQSIYLFTPLTDQLQIQLTGIVDVVPRTAEVNFSLFDTIANSVVDSHIWDSPPGCPFEWTGFGAVFGQTEIYAVTPGREYSLTLNAIDWCEEQPTTRAELFANITPEPATLLLLGLGATTILRRNR